MSTAHAQRPGLWLPPRQAPRGRLVNLPRVEIGVPRAVIDAIKLHVLLGKLRGIGKTNMSMTDYAELELLKFQTGQSNAMGTAITPYIALFTAAPSESAAGTEVATGAYARTSSSGKWAAPSAGSVTTNAAVTFPVCTNQYVLLGVALADASTAGNEHRWSAISSKTIAVNDQANLPSGGITFTSD